jgi:glycosyltransferase involved in cell wall biosynthesis
VYFPRPLRGKWTSDLLWKIVLGVYNQFDLVTAPSETAAAILRQQPIHIKVVAVSNGVQLERFKRDDSIKQAAIRRKYGLDAEKKIFLFVGRLEAEKRADLLIEALGLLGREDAQVAIVGIGTQFERLVQLTHEKKLEGKVKLLGYVPQEDLPLLLNSVDFFCMPSPHEGQSIATLEALACGLPVLAANARALPELVHNGENGYLFEAESAESLAECMKVLLEAPEDWARMGEASLRIAQGHGLERSVERYEELYEEVRRIHERREDKRLSTKEHEEEQIATKGPPPSLPPF